MEASGQIRALAFLSPRTAFLLPTGSWMDAMYKNKISRSSRESNYDFSVFQPVAYVQYRLHHTAAVACLVYIVLYSAVKGTANPGQGLRVPGA